MSGFFSIDSPLFTFLGKACDVMFISLIWFVSCLPIVTIGPATTALYYVIVKVIRRDRGYIFREYCRSFKENFKVGIISGLIFLLLAVVLIIDYNFSIQMMQQNSMAGTLFFAVYCAIVLACLFTLMFIFPILSRFTVTVKGLFKTAFFMSVRHFPTTLLLILIFAAAVAGCLLTVVGVAVIPAAACLLSSFLIERVFKKYMPKPEESAEESGKDTWYLE